MIVRMHASCLTCHGDWYILGNQVVNPQTVDDARFVNVKLLMTKLGVTETNIVLNIFARSVFPKYGFKHRAVHALRF